MTSGRDGPGGPGLHADVVVVRGPFELRARVDVAPGEVLAVLGPNGAGKTTLLRTLAGLTALTQGRIVLGAEVWDDPPAGVFVPTVDRAVGVVFQDYRLFPHLSVLDNVAFAAHARGAGRRTARRGAGEWLARTGIADLADRRPGRLSGGQAQRAALARALASDPRLLLLDEPLAALDARTRVEIRAELRRHLGDFPGPCLLVTHEPLEAMVLADQIVVLEHGRVVQHGPPASVARRPATAYVAHLVGLNLYRGRLRDARTAQVDLDGGGVLYAAGHDPSPDAEPVAATPAGAEVLVVLAPSAVSIHAEHPGPGSARNTWEGVVTGLESLTDRVRVAVEGRPPALVDITAAALADLRLAPGQPVWLSAKATEVVAYPEGGAPIDA